MGSDLLFGMGNQPSAVAAISYKCEGHPIWNFIDENAEVIVCMQSTLNRSA
jgi:hypothetical protein